MSDSVSLASPAKINLTLDVLGPRPDGYHNLASVMQTISLADRLTVVRSDEVGIGIDCDPSAAPNDDRNLAWRAADALLREAGRSDGLRIRLEKRIPAQAGLGGGSSNAAAALMAVNRLLALGLDRDALVRVAAKIGSDVAFFLYGGTASVRGMGERIQPLPDCPALHLVIVKPEAGVSTGEAYAALDALPDRVSARATRDMETLLACGDAERIIGRMTNDFERVVPDRHLPVALAMDDLLMARTRNARLCGSGAAVFGVARGGEDAEGIARVLRRKYRQVFVCRTLGRKEAGPFADGSGGLA